MDNIELPHGRGARLDADMVGGKDASLFHNSTDHIVMKALDNPQPPMSGSKMYTRFNETTKKHELCVAFPSGAVQVISTQA